MIRIVMIWLALILPANAGQSLFNGKNLDGWVQHGGKARYAVENGAIVGRSAPNTANSFLCTKRAYGNFELEYDYKCDDGLNSGVQIRSNVYEHPTKVEWAGKSRQIPAGRVHGYQVEIDPDKPDRMWSAGIYDEARRGWLYPGLDGGDAAAFTDQGKKVYKPNEWNHVRVVCRGDHIQTWLNGAPRADFHDGMTGSGLIGLQVHGVGGRQEPLSVRWKNLQVKELEE